MKRTYLVSNDDFQLKRVHCAGCGAAMIWHRTERGKAMPLSVATAQPAGSNGWNLEPHWADCPERARFNVARRQRPAHE